MRRFVIHRGGDGSDGRRHWRWCADIAFKHFIRIRLIASLLPTLRLLNSMSTNPKLYIIANMGSHLLVSHAAYDDIIFSVLITSIMNNKWKLLLHVSYPASQCHWPHQAHTHTHRRPMKANRKIKLVSFGTLGSFRFSHSIACSFFLYSFFCFFREFRFVWLLLARTLAVGHRLDDDVRQNNAREREPPRTASAETNGMKPNFNT